MKVGPEWRAEHVLADGTRIVLRTIRPEDASTLREEFERLSPESRYRRFFAGMQALSDATLRYLTNVDGVDHVAIVAIVEAPDLKTERGVGVARFIRVTGEPTIAEVAVTVCDDMQGKGVGRHLLLALTEAARERGVHHFRGEVLASNAPVRAILEEVGAHAKREESGALVFDVAIDGAEKNHHRPSALERLLRAAAASMAGAIRSLRPPA